jgi:hypothetical protein
MTTMVEFAASDVEVEHHATMCEEGTRDGGVEVVDTSLNLRYDDPADPGVKVISASLNLRYNDPADPSS